MINGIILERGNEQRCPIWELLPEELLSHSALLLGFAGSHQDVSES